ncbi:MAG TPA: TetR/AcrR family transcriptional regulator [Streptosporangiaceae bacterium]|jgi:AcrR family transcriptional regulator|nr:TetR/AcrR family transcriptional regulator [Streptosporangiaceae bacterium]
MNREPVRATLHEAAQSPPGKPGAGEPLHDEVLAPGDRGSAVPLGKFHILSEQRPGFPGRQQDGEAPRGKLLAAAVDYVLAHGLGELSLRDLAGAIGTSHRMLIYHFGSKEGLLVAIVRAIEENERNFLAGLAADPAADPAAGPGAGPAAGPVEATRIMWSRLADPAMWPSERLFFEVYSQALQGRPGTAGFARDMVESWVELAADANPFGLPAASARADARLGVAVMRGLLLDLLATGDHAAVNAAFERFVNAIQLGLRQAAEENPS